MRKAVLFSGVCAVLGLASVIGFAGEDGDAKGKPPYVLEVAVVLDAPGTTLAFTLSNKSSQIVETTPLGTNYNRIIIEKPDGTRHEHFSWKRGIPPVKIGPEASRTWRMEAGVLLEAAGQRNPGSYRITWKVNDVESVRIALLKEPKGKGNE